MRKTAHVRSLTTILRQLPSHKLPDLYPVVVLLCGIAVAESYGLISYGSVQSLASRSDSLIASIGETGLTLNNGYGSMLPRQWLDQTMHWGNEVESDASLIRAIAHSLATVITGHEMESTWLGKINE